MLQWIRAAIGRLWKRFFSEPIRLPALGELVSHEGSFGLEGDEHGAYFVVALLERAILVDGKPKAVTFCRFANKRFTVTCLLDELQWLEEDQAWLLPGRLLSGAQKAKWMELTSSLYPPAPDKHVEARAALRSHGMVA